MIYQKLILAITFIGLTSCSALMSQNTGKQSQSSSLMEYLYPDKENECPPPPKCSQVINVAKGGKIEGGIVQNFNCDSSPGPPKPSPSPSVWDKIKNFLKRVNPKVLIAPAAILAIAIIVVIFEKRKGK